MSALREFAGYARTLSPRGASQSSAPVGASAADAILPQSKAAAPSGGSQLGPTIPSASPLEAGPQAKAGRELGESEIKRLAKWPNEAHATWKNLSESARMIVVVQIASIYGSDFSHKFVAYTKSGADLTMTLDNLDHPADYFQKKGFRLVDTSDEPIDISGPPGFEWQVWIHPSGQQVRWRPEATVGPDQKAFNAALAKLEKDVEPLKNAQSTILQKQQDIDQGDPTDADRPDKFDAYQKALEGIKGQIKAALAEAKTIRERFTPKGVDTSPLDPLVDRLTRLGKFVDKALEPDNLDRFRPLVTSDEPPIDYSGQ